MPRADYYILGSADYDSRELLACRLCEKAISQGLKVSIYTSSKADLNQLDQRLWSFRADSFIPHAILHSNSNAAFNSVQLTDKAELLQPDSDLLINLGTEPPDTAAQFNRVVEIVSQSPDVLAATRNSYKLRKEAGWELHRHDQRSN